MDEKGDYYITLGSVLMRVNKNNFSVKVFNIAARDILFDQKEDLFGGRQQPKRSRKYGCAETI
ncbi:MAG: hypothetical protein IPH46_09625 [Bacteroidetes bacterium]|nr:hypothetical protein [Bacteroidota bacterium]